MRGGELTWCVKEDGGPRKATKGFVSDVSAIFTCSSSCSRTLAAQAFSVRLTAWLRVFFLVEKLPSQRRTRASRLLIRFHFELSTCFLLSW